MIAVSTFFAGAFSAWVRKVDWQRNKINNINYMQFTIITMSFSDFTSDLTWGCQVVLAGGKGGMFGFASLAVTIFVMAYNMRKLHTILYGGNDWAKLNNKHKNKFPGIYAALFMLATTDMELLCLFPWAKDFSTGSDGFPHPDAVAAAHSSGYIEDSLQILCWILHAAFTGGVTLSGILTFATSVGGSILRMGTQLKQRGAFAEESEGGAVQMAVVAAAGLEGVAEDRAGGARGSRGHQEATSAAEIEAQIRANDQERRHLEARRARLARAQVAAKGSVS